MIIIINIALSTLLFKKKIFLLISYLKIVNLFTMYKKNCIALIIFLTISSCETTDDNRLLGKIIGSGLGALVGFQFGSGVGGALFIAGGTVLGGFIGNEIANELSENEINEYGNATKDALDKNTNNEPKNWTNKEKTKLGKITPLNRYEKNKFLCRDIEQNLTFEGVEKKSFSTFCKNNKGDWETI